MILNAIALRGIAIYNKKVFELVLKYVTLNLLQSSKYLNALSNQRVKIFGILFFNEVQIMLNQIFYPLPNGTWYVSKL